MVPETNNECEHGFRLACRHGCPGSRFTCDQVPAQEDQAAAAVLHATTDPAAAADFGDPPVPNVADAITNAPGGSKRHADAVSVEEQVQGPPVGVPNSKAAEIARDYLRKGWCPIPVPYKSKAPKISGWQDRRLQEKDLAIAFGGKTNIGIVLGPASNGLTDVDLDCHEAVELASHVLPRTKAMFGRASKPASHRLYLTKLASTSEESSATIVFRDPTDGSMLLEVRVGGVKAAQTIFPGSVHEGGEDIRWDEQGEPAEVAATDLLKAAHLLAGACLLARHWRRKGARHDAALSLGGFLARAGLPTPEIKYLVDAMARVASDPEPKDRRNTAEDAAQAFRSGKRARGFPLLVKTFGKQVAEQVADWLDYNGSRNDDGAPAGDLPTINGTNDMERLNALYAVLPIGGKTRVVTFGELAEFPGRQTIVMTQTIADFKALQNKYRHTYSDGNGGLKSKPLGTYWIENPERRQYDGGMAFMPQHDGDVGDKLNLYRGFGVKPVRLEGTRAAESCARFLDFMGEIICSGNTEHFDYLVKREATIIQKRIRTEVALCLQTDEEGCGKGFYEATMGKLLGNHAMQVGNPEHIIGKFNPHLETLLRLTADEALFVGDHRHRNALFGLITEPTLTIEPKGCAVYQAASYLNLSITSNSGHFIPVSDTARRFFVPTVSAKRKQDFDYFAGLQAELNKGGYPALLYYLLYEVDLTGFNVRKVPQTVGLRHQRDQSLPPLEAWFSELLETGTLWGSDPKAPNRAVSTGYARVVKASVFDTQTRTVHQPGLYDQARKIEPKLRNYTNDRSLGDFLREMGCTNITKVLRRQGWTFPPLLECRKRWETRYPGWQWRDPELDRWQLEEADTAFDGPSDDEYSAKIVADAREALADRGDAMPGKPRF